MILTKINGGLGNQMFQYAIAKAIAVRNNDVLKLDISIYPKQKLRAYELDKFNIDVKYASTLEVLFFDSLRYFRKIVRKLFKKEIIKSYFYEDTFAKFNDKVFDCRNITFLEGYWQNELYFKDIRNQLLLDFVSKSPISEELFESLEFINKTNSVSMHIRRGDYVSNQHTNSIHGVCDIDYYRKAYQLMKQDVENPIFFIFSDDIEWCKENINFDHDIKFIDNSKSALDDFELMRNCNHNIIANSTFSWWAAWLNNNESKIVVVPKNWFSDKKYQAMADSLIPNEWVQI